MAADVATSLKNLSTTESSNSPAGSTTISTNLDDNLRTMQAVMRQPWARDSIASAGTTDIGSKDAGSLDVTGTTTITALGTVSAGIRKWIRFAGALTLTHNGTSLILPTGANITTAANDVCLMESLGSGNWVCLSYMKANGQTVALSSTFADGTEALPGMAFTADPDNGFYRIGTNNFGVSTAGSKRIDIGSSIVLTPSSGGTYTFGAPLTLLTGGTSAASLKTADNSSVTGSLTLGTGDSSLNYSGPVNITTGSGYAPVSGDITIKTGDANTGFANGGASLNIVGGNKTHGSAAGDGTKVNIRAGYSATLPGKPPVVNLQAQPVASTPQTIVRVNSFRGVLQYTTPTGDSTSLASPTITSGAGSTGTIAGTNYGFRVTYGGTGISATLQVALGAWPNGAQTPIVTFSLQGAAAIAGRITANTGSSITIVMASPPSDGDILHVQLSYFE